MGPISSLFHLLDITCITCEHYIQRWFVIIIESILGLSVAVFCSNYYVKQSGTLNGITVADAIEKCSAKLGWSDTTTAQLWGETQGREPFKPLCFISFLSCVSPSGIVTNHCSTPLRQICRAILESELLAFLFLLPSSVIVDARKPHLFRRKYVCTQRLSPAKQCCWLVRTSIHSYISLCVELIKYN